MAEKNDLIPYDDYGGYFEGIDDFNENRCIPFEMVFETTIMDRLEFQVIMGFLYSFIWLVGTISNALVLYVVLSESRRARPWTSSRRVSSVSSSASTVATSAFFSVRFVFVASLACADLLTTFTSLPVTSINFFTRQWLFPSFVCHVIGVLQGFSIFQSSFTFTCIAVDRYLLIFYPNRNVMTKRKATIGLSFTALLSLLLASPMAMIVSVLDNPIVMEGAPPLCGRFCIEGWSNRENKGSETNDATSATSYWDQRVYGTLVLIVQFGLPATVTSFCYWQVACRLRNMRKNRRRSEMLSLNLDPRRPSSASGGLSSNSCILPNGSASSTTSGKRQRTNRMMLAMVIAFILSWSPYNILNLSRDFGWAGYINGIHVFPPLYAVAHLCGMTTLIWNPLMYAWFNKSIRDSLKVILFWRCREF